MSDLDISPDAVQARGGLRDLIQEMDCCSQAEEQKIFEIASAWGDRRVAYERARVLNIAAGLLSTPAYEVFKDRVESGATSAW